MDAKGGRSWMRFDKYPMTLRQIGAVVGCAFLFALSIPAAEETQRQNIARADSGGLTHCVADGSYRAVCPGRPDALRAGQRVGGATYDDTAIVAHPAGCPRRAFCGCGVSVKVFGRPVRDLFLAANWLVRFPRTSPAAGMVAARRGHVFYIVSYLGDGNALAYDPNSGGRKTRIHVRSLAGYRVVDPHGARVALR